MKHKKTTRNGKENVYDRRMDWKFRKIQRR